MHGSKLTEALMYPVYITICTILLPILAVVGITQTIINYRKEKNKEKHNEQC